MKPKVIFLADKKGWAYSSVAQEIMKRLSGKYKFELYHANHERPDLKRLKFDLLYVFFWGENYWRRFNIPIPSYKVIREVASYRWRDEERYGYLTHEAFCRRYLNDCNCVTSPAKRIVKEIENHRNLVFHTPNGIDSSVFKNRKNRRGKLKIGWVGNPNDPLKSLKEILIPAVQNRFDFNFTDGSLNRKQLIDFYNEIDVLAISSISEGQPLPLLEGMACGCFPVATDVGIVPELITTKQNGLVVDRSILAFTKAFEWCDNNLDYIRATGESNSIFIRSHRDWDLMAPKFDSLFSAALEKDCTDDIQLFKTIPIKRIAIPPEPNSQKKYENYSNHLTNIQGEENESYQRVRSGLFRELEPMLPADRNQVILEIGIGFGHILSLLLEKGYRNIYAADLSKDLIDFVQQKFQKKLKGAFWCDGKDILGSNPDMFDIVILYDVIEHIPHDKLETFMLNLHRSLSDGGKAVIRTPNMALPLAAFSRYIDFTHTIGFTEFSIRQLMTAAGFSSINIFKQMDSRSWHVRFLYKLYKFLLKKLFYLEGRTTPTCFDKNILIEAMK